MRFRWRRHGFSAMCIKSDGRGVLAARRHPEDAMEIVEPHARSNMTSKVNFYQRCAIEAELQRAHRIIHSAPNHIIDARVLRQLMDAQPDALEATLFVNDV